MWSVASEPLLSLRTSDEVCQQFPAASICDAGTKRANIAKAPQSEEDWEAHRQTICDIYMSSTVAEVMTRMELEHGFKATFVFILKNTQEVSLISEG